MYHIQVEKERAHVHEKAFIPTIDMRRSRPKDRHMHMPVIELSCIVISWATSNLEALQPILCGEREGVKIINMRGWCYDKIFDHGMVI